MTLEEFYAALGAEQVDGRKRAVCETGDPYVHYLASVDGPGDVVPDEHLIAALYGAIGAELAKPGKIYWRRRPTIERNGRSAISCRLVKTDHPVNEQLLADAV